MSELVVPKGWELKTLYDAFEESKEKWNPTSKEEMLNYVGLENIESNSGKIVGFSQTLSSTIKSNKTKFSKNDVLYGKLRPYLNKVLVPDFDGVCSTDILVLNPKKEILRRYLFYFLLSNAVLLPISNLTYGTKMPRTKVDDLVKLSFPLPPLSIQKQIVAKLDHILGQLEEKKKQILTIIENNTQRIDFFEKNWQRFLINKEIENHPQRKNWSLKKLSQVTISHDGKRIPLNKSQRSEIPGQYAYYGASGQVDSINDYKFDGKFMLLAEDGENLNTQKKPIAFIVEGKFWVNNHAHVLQTNSELNLDFLCYYMNSLNIMQFAKKQSTRPKLNKSDMNEIPVLLPSLETQKQIIQNIKSAEEKFQSQKEQFQNIKDSYESTIKYIEHMQSSILDAAFSGKLVQ